MHRNTVSLMIFAATLAAASSGAAALAQNATVADSAVAVAPQSGSSTTTPVPTTTAKPLSWIASSDQYTRMLLDVQLKHSPETASTLGLTSYDTAITDASRADEIAQRKQLEEALATLKKAAAKEQDERVRQDMQILQSFYSLEFRRADYSLNHKVEFVDPSLAISSGLRTLLNDKVAPDRRSAAVVRLRKYTGVESGFKPFTEVLQQRLIEQMAKPGLVYPSSYIIESQLAQDKDTIDGLGALFVKYKLTGWQEAFAKLQEQLASYDTWIRTVVLPKADNHASPTAEESTLALEGYGIGIPLDQLVSQARAAFNDTQKQMAPLAAELAKQRGWSSSDYRDGIASLKKTQIAADAILPFYQSRLKAIEGIIAEKKLVTLPTVPAALRLATSEEASQSPVPRLIPLQKPLNGGQRSEFILPLRHSDDDKSGSKADKSSPADDKSKNSENKDIFNDFNYDAVAWPTIARELRPGNELEIYSLAKNGLSLARRRYAFNAIDANRWGLYSEWLIQPYEPADGQLVTLQLRLLRAAEVFLASDLQSGKITADDATKLLVKDVALTSASAKREVERINSPAYFDADSDFYGYTTLVQLRQDAALALGRKFDVRQFNDFVLAQGVLPPDLLRKAVLEDFVPAQKKKK
jgi:uncharacterized protein (DUF885 family)